jgi:hypothetical protein
LVLALLATGQSRADHLFVRGDVDASERVEVTDAVRVFRHLFADDGRGLSCPDAADADDDGTLTISDGMFALDFLFRQGERPASPFPHCGTDPTDDDLDRVSTERNTDRFQIHTVGLGMNRISNQDGTLRLIAEENGGVYVRFETAGDVPDTGEVIPR